MTDVSGPGHEEGGEPGLDIVRDLLRGAVFGIAEGAGAGGVKERSAGASL